MPGVAANVVRSLLVWLICITLAVYLLNPGGGVKELFPDDRPFFGNLDEAIAAVILVSGLRYFGIDLACFFTPRRDGGA